MIKLSHIAAVFFFVATLVAAKEIYRLNKDVDRWKGNYSTAQAEKAGIKKYYAGKLALYEVSAQSFSRAEFRTMFQALSDSLTKQLRLVKPSQIVQVTAKSYIDTTVTTTDTVTNQSTAQTWAFRSPTIQIRAIEAGNERRLSIRQTIELTITRSLKRREGFFRRIFLVPLKREGVYTVVPSDSSLHIEKFSVYEIQ